MTIPTTDRSYCSLSAVYSIAHRGIHSRHQSAQQADHRDEQNPNPVENMLHVFTLPRPARPVKIFHSSCHFFFGKSFHFFIDGKKSIFLLDSALQMQTAKHPILGFQKDSHLQLTSILGIFHSPL